MSLTKEEVSKALYDYLRNNATATIEAHDHFSTKTTLPLIELYEEEAKLFGNPSSLDLQRYIYFNPFNGNWFGKGFRADRYRKNKSKSKRWVWLYHPETGEMRSCEEIAEDPFWYTGK